MPAQKEPGVGSQSTPVARRPSRTVSRGPPLLHATTGLPATMASNGTIPKCSSAGTQRDTAMHRVARALVGPYKHPQLAAPLTRRSVNHGRAVADHGPLLVLGARPHEPHVSRQPQARGKLRQLLEVLSVFLKGHGR